MDEPQAVHDVLRDHGVQLRALHKRMEAITAGDQVRADAIIGVIPAANAATSWFVNGNLLGNGTKADFLARAGVWISGTFVAGRAYYEIGAYSYPFISGVNWQVNDNWVGWGHLVDYRAGTYVWISGTMVGGRAIIEIGGYYQGGGGGASGTVGFYENGGLFCDALQLDLVEGYGVWISGTCVEAGGKAHYEIGTYPGSSGGDDTLALAYAVAF